MKIYVAAMYRQMLEMRDVAARLRAAGHEVTAQWIEGKEGAVDGAATDETLEAAALMDFADVARSDVLIAYSQKYGMLHTGGGRHVEFGIAMALRKQIVVVGPRGEHIFHAWPHVTFCDTLEQAVEVLACRT